MPTHENGRIADLCPDLCNIRSLRFDSLRNGEVSKGRGRPTRTQRKHGVVKAEQMTGRDVPIGVRDDTGGSGACMSTTSGLCLCLWRWWVGGLSIISTAVIIINKAVRKSGGAAVTDIGQCL